MVARFARTGQKTPEQCTVGCDPRRHADRRQQARWDADLDQPRKVAGKRVRLRGRPRAARELRGRPQATTVATLAATRSRGRAPRPGYGPQTVSLRNLPSRRAGPSHRGDPTTVETGRGPGTGQDLGANGLRLDGKRDQRRTTRTWRPYHRHHGLLDGRRRSDSGRRRCLERSAWSYGGRAPEPDDAVPPGGPGAAGPGLQGMKMGGWRQGFAVRKVASTASRAAASG